STWRSTPSAYHAARRTCGCVASRRDPRGQSPRSRSCLARSSRCLLLWSLAQEVAQLVGQPGAGHRALLAAREVLEPDLAAFPFVSADEPRGARAALSRRLHLSAESLRLDVQLDDEVVAQLTHEPRRVVARRVHRHDEHAARRRCRTLAALLQHEHHAVETDREPDARRRRPAQLFDESIVAPAAAERALRPERTIVDFERRTRVVVEPAHQTVIDLRVNT